MTDLSIRTSDSHPIRIDSVQPLGAWGQVGMSFCPGKVQADARTGAWARDLGKDIERIREWGASTVVSLIETHEFRELQVENLHSEVTKHGMSWIHLPIRDMHAPGEDFKPYWQKLGKQVVGELAQGNKVFVHCKGGLGRAGTITACLLIESGMAHFDAIEYVRTARRKTIETLSQELYVLNYRPLFQSAERNANSVYRVR